MTTSTTPEISALAILLDGIRTWTEANQSTLNAIEYFWPSSSNNKLIEFMTVLGSLERLVLELDSTPARRTAQKTVDTIVRVFTASNLTGTVNDFRKQHRTELHFIENTLDLLQDLSVDKEKFSSSIANIEEEIDQISAKFLKSSLSDASKSVLMAQLQLLKNSAKRFDGGQVGPFRDSAFSTIGRVVIQIRKDSNIPDADKREMIDDALRLYDVIEKGGNLLSLAAPFIAGYLMAPGSN